MLRKIEAMQVQLQRGTFECRACRLRLPSYQESCEVCVMRARLLF